MEAQVALNGLDAACEAHLGRLRLHLEDEVGASYGSDRGDPAVAKLLEAVAALGRRGSAGEAFGDALEKARAALASTALAQPIARSIAGRGDVGARALRARRHRRGRAAPLGLRRALEALGRSTCEIKVHGAFVLNRRVDLHAIGDACSIAWRCGLSPRLSQHGRVLAKIVESPSTRVDDSARGARAPPARRARLRICASKSVDAARRTAAAAGDALLEELRDRARVKKATPLGALQLDRDVRALRAALAAASGRRRGRGRRARGPRPRAARRDSARPRRPRRGVDVVSRYVAPDGLPEVRALGGGRASPRRSRRRRRPRRKTRSWP